MNLKLIFAGIAVAGVMGAQAPSPTPARSSSAKHDVGSGAGDIGKGAAKGVSSAAKGTGKAAVDLATLHPIDAAADAGRGAVATGKNLGVGTVKGSAKILKGTGKALKHLF